MILIINTIEEDSFTIALTDSDGFIIKKKSIKGKYHQAERVLPEIDLILKSVEKSWKNIKGIIAVKGPGGFTAIRIGLVTANTIGYALNIPIVGYKKNNFSDIKELAIKGVKKLKTTKKNRIIIPYYGREPNITISKKKLY